MKKTDKEGGKIISHEVIKPQKKMYTTATSV